MEESDREQYQYQEPEPEPEPEQVEGSVIIPDSDREQVEEQVEESLIIPEPEPEPEPEIAQEIDLEETNLRFYLLNIIHDIMHDYGKFSAPTRWTANTNYLTQIIGDTYTINSIIDIDDGDNDGNESIHDSVVTGGGFWSTRILNDSLHDNHFVNDSLHDNQQKKKRLRTSDLRTPDSPQPAKKQKKQKKISIKDAIERKDIKDEFILFVEEIKIAAVFGLFSAFSAKFVGLSMNVYELSYKVFAGLGYINKTLYPYIVDKFADCLLLQTNSRDVKDLNINITYDIFDQLNSFLDNDNIEKCIKQFLIEQIGGSKKQIGGDMDYATALAFKSNLETIVSEFVTEATVYINSHKDSWNQQEYKNIVEQFYTRVKATDQFANTVGRIDNTKQKNKIFSLIFNLSIFGRWSTHVINTLNSDVVNFMSNILKNTGAEQSISVKIKQIKEAEILLRKAAAADASDGMSTALKKVRTEFLQAVAGIGLYLNFDNSLSYEAMNELCKSNQMLMTELNILCQYAQIERSPSRYNDLDTKLLDAANDVYIKNPNPNPNLWTKENGRYYCPASSKLYAIDNASLIGSKDRENTVFCSLTSIIDGMNQCTIGSDGPYNAANVEYGNMLFRIKSATTPPSTSPYYEGQLKLSNNFGMDEGTNFGMDEGIKTVSYTVKYKGFNQSLELPLIETTIDDINVKPGKIRNLEAHNILKNTLVKLLKFVETKFAISGIQSQDDVYNNALARALLNGNTFFINLLNIIRTNQFSTQTDVIQTFTITVPDRNELLQCFFTILGKGAGDIFQEINSVCKHGGYVSPIKTTIATKSISDWYDNGTAVRMFIANDRPSAVRFWFLLINGNPNQINTLSYGGYVSHENYILKHSSMNTKYCDNINIQNRVGGSLKKRTNNTMKNKKNKKHRYSIKKNKNIKTKTKTKMKHSIKKHKKHKNTKTRKQ